MPPLFLSAASLVEIEAVIDRVRGRNALKGCRRGQLRHQDKERHRVERWL